MKLLVLDLKSKSWIILFSLFYISLVLFVSFLGVSSFYPGRLDGSYTGVSHNFVPFATIGTYLFNIHSYNFTTWFSNTFGVVLLFIPIGVLIPLLLPKLKNTSTIVLILMFSLTIELVQYVTQLGVFNVDDIMLNTLGGFIGILICSYLKRKRLLN
ncbi:VanZ family protein [Halalkalibacter akibai]|uniref:Possible antibiotic resistance protein n=1 Tax=Halalkalibacter akibai (strain ATCC 43226 / DSM 21942 / CIP 109018 / JCM 9157 / 1139) TaxID=1236973 RepID=W4QZX5_HALA3|nr:VanZ family protein [Halalkalibacter akibai]GAE37685.1 possible antibiotic resistance protein [Halalkalibacter akibai JCM 9157]